MTEFKADFMNECHCSNGMPGHWSTDGCTPNKDKSNENKTVCECTHLTNFAILMSPFAEVSSYFVCIGSNVFNRI